MKPIIKIMTVFIITIFCVYGFLVYKNNHSTVKASPEEIKRSYEMSVAWLMKNRKMVLQEQNPILWWMIERSAEITNDERLKSLLAELKATIPSTEFDPGWQIFIKPEKYWGTNFPDVIYTNFSGYQKYFVFGITCGKNLAEDPIIVAQHDVNFCDKNDSTPACITHQLMAYRFMQRYGCDRVDRLDDRVRSLQEKIYDKLVKDPRVIDVYFQRVLMLVDSGAANKVKAVWVQRILDAQLSDGSWSWKQRLLYLGFDHYLSFGDIYYVLYPGKAPGTFHTTAQGIWLMSLLQQQKNYSILSTSSN